MANEALVRNFSAAIERAYSQKTRRVDNQADFDRQHPSLSKGEYDRAIRIINAVRDVRLLDALAKACRQYGGFIA